MKNIYQNINWLASYPKSGNTWFRIFLSSLNAESDKHININQLNLAPIASSRELFDQYLGVNTSDLTLDEIENLRPDVYKKLSHESKHEIFLKTHDAWKLNSQGKPIFPYEVTNRVLYFIRNPLDVAVSFAFHSDTNFIDTIQYMSENSYGLCMNKNKLFHQLSQHMYSWSEHVISWINHSGLPVHIVRYEDMLDQPFHTFTKALNFLNIKYVESDVNIALENCSFKNLAVQEEKYGFKEKTINSQKFFRSGSKNDWKKHLKKFEVDQIIRKHRIIMETFGYMYNT